MALLLPLSLLKSNYDSHDLNSRWIQSAKQFQFRDKQQISWEAGLSLSFGLTLLLANLNNEWVILTTWPCLEDFFTSCISPSRNSWKVLEDVNASSTFINPEIRTEILVTNKARQVGSWQLENIKNAKKAKKRKQEFRLLGKSSFMTQQLGARRLT